MPSQQITAHPPAPHECLRAYSRWALGVWALPGDQRGNNDSLLVMGFGLAGETGEALELITPSGAAPGQEDTLAKEVGDIFYYWSRLCTENGVDPVDCWQSVLPEGHDLPTDINQAAHALAALVPPCPIQQMGLDLSVQNGLVLEQLKKKVRDGTFDPECFTRAMGKQAQAWCVLLAGLDMKASVVLGITVAKVESRIRRGTLLGSGNHR